MAAPETTAAVVTSAKPCRPWTRTSSPIVASTLQTVVRSSAVQSSAVIESAVESAVELTAIPSSTVLLAVTPTSATSVETPGSSTDDYSGTTDGFASLNGGTTGGSGGEIVVVSTQEDLETYAAMEGIKISGVITITPKGKEVEVVSDKTIFGIGADAGFNEGGFNLQNVGNVIFRNIKIGKWIGK